MARIASVRKDGREHRQSGSFRPGSAAAGGPRAHSRLKFRCHAEHRVRFRRKGRLSFLYSHLYNVTQVDLTARVAMKAGAKAKKIPIRITHPNSCSLKYDELGLKLRDMLSASGIEPREPADLATTDAATPVAPALVE